MVSISTTGTAQNSNTPSCAQMADAQNRVFNPMGRMNSNLAQHMPRLVVPDEAVRQPQAFLRGGSSQSGNSAETNSEVSIEWPLTQVYRHFADQIIAQGWELDTESTGEISASGNWRREEQPDLSLHGVLNVLETAESEFQLQFRLTKIGNEP